MIRMRVLTAGLTVLFSTALSQSLIAPAYSQTIDLVCTGAASNPILTYVSIDISAKTATWWFSPHTREDADVSDAIITEDKVTWSYEHTQAADGRIYMQMSWKFTLDRDTGSLDTEGTTNGRFSMGHTDCKRATRVF
ncbi:MAG: hypothetical protein ABSF70_01470 [Terracidiphilus sp.]|jgi:hypothetical protein